MSEFNLATADKHELKFYGNNALGLNLTNNMNEETMRKKILEHCEAEGLDAPKSEVNAPAGAKKQPWVTINIAKQDKKGGAEPAFVGLQGVGYTIPRGVDIDVPPGVVGILQNAKQEIVTQDPDSGEIEKEEIYTYPFQIIRKAG